MVKAKRAVKRTKGRNQAKATRNNLKVSFVEEINGLKKIKSLEGFKSALDKKLLNPIFQANVFYTPELFKENFRKESYVLKSSDLLKELHISIVKINKSKNIINQFAKIKLDFERFVLSGQIEQAAECLESVRDFYGLSYWYIENKLAILVRQGSKSLITDFYDEVSTEKLRPVEKRDFDLLFDKSLETIPADRIDFSLDSIIEGLSPECTDYSTIDFLFRFNPAKVSDFEAILRYYGPCNIIDIYLTTTRIFYTYYANKLINDEILDSIYSVIGIEDDKWLNFISLLKEDFKITDREESFLEICDEYIKGNFTKVITLSELTLRKWPEMVTIYEFYANSLYNTGTECQLNPSGLLFQIIDTALIYIAARGDLDINTLNKTFYQYTTIDASQFINLIKSKSNILTQKKTSETIYRFMDISSTSVNPFRQYSFNDGSFCHKLLTNENSDEVIESLPEYRALKRKADQFFEQRDYKNANLLYEKVTTPPLHFKDELIIKKILCSLKSGNIERATIELCEKYFSKDINMRRFPCKEFLQELENFPEELPCLIQITIAIYILTKATNGDMHTVALYFDDYMDDKSISFPSEIIPDTAEKRFLLEFALNTDVLEGIHICRKIYDGSSHLMFDRVLILSSLLDSEHDEQKKELFKNEISFLGHQYAKNFSLKDLSPGKIEVDRAVLTSMALESNKDLFSSILVSLGSEPPLPDFDETGTFKGNEKTSHRGSFTFAYQLLLDIRDLYTLDGYYGLDYSLNTDIRHNGIVPVIRSVFEKHNLISNKVDGEYTDNIEFESRYKRGLSPYFYEQFQDELKEFSAFIDLRINNLKTRAIKIITNDNDDKERIFKFIIIEEDVSKLLSLISAGSSYEDCIKWCFDHLENLTEKSMEVGRALILNGLDSEFTGKLTKLSQSLNRIGRGNKDFLERITLVKNDLKNTLTEVSDWLAFSKKTGEDFTLEFPIYEAQLFVEKIFPKVKINISINNDDASALYDGRSLKSFIKAFIMLIENAAKRRLHDSRINIAIDILQEGQSVVINTSNSTKKIDKEIIENINQNINGLDITSEANREKGSGLYKVKKIFDIDLKIENKIKIITQAKKFTVSIKYLNNSLLVTQG